MSDEQTQQSVWNFDGAELYLIFQIKSSIAEALDKWDIKTAYKKVRLLRMELDAAFTREKKKILEEYDEEELKNKLQKDKPAPEKKLTEKQEVDALMKQIDEAYTAYLKDGEFSDDEKSLMFQLIEKFYMHLCYIMKRHGLYFREGEDFRLAVLRR
jgi:hypothetical protein